jgi:hypothetical protein
MLSEQRWYVPAITVSVLGTEADVAEHKAVVWALTVTMLNAMKNKFTNEVIWIWIDQ